MDTQEIVAKGRTIVHQFNERATYEDMDELVVLFGQLAALAVTACHDDSVECTYCVWPEHTAVVLTIGGDTHACKGHVWDALVHMLGVRDREVPDEALPASDPRSEEYPAHLQGQAPGPCPCRCQQGRHCGGCGHAGCGYRP